MVAPVPPRILSDREPAVASPPIGDPKTVAWRYDQLRKAGYSIRSAALVAERQDVDLHAAIEIVESGCPVPQALRILL